MNYKNKDIHYLLLNNVFRKIFFGWNGKGRQMCSSHYSNIYHYCNIYSHLGIIMRIKYPRIVGIIMIIREIFVPLHHNCKIRHNDYRQ